MKRIGNLYQKIISVENLNQADRNAQKGKSGQYGIMVHNKNRTENIKALHEALKNKTFSTSKYDVFKVYEPKEREVYRLPYYPDRIVHHAIMNVLEPIFVSVYTSDSYSCIKNKGIHNALDNIKKSLKDISGTKYCLKLDVTKFYPSIDHQILKYLLEKKFKDKELIWLLFEIIDSAPGLPIGNYLSQYLANFYMTYFDHWIKENRKVKHYFRYADDIVILASNKPYLHKILGEINHYLLSQLKLKVKSNYQVFPVETRGVDFLGYRIFHTHVLLRKRIKKNFAKMLVNNPNDASIASYMGWAKHCNSNHLIKKLMPNAPV